MTIKHFVKLIRPRMQWFVSSKKDLFRQWRRLKTTQEIRERGRKLSKVALRKEQQNTFGTLKEAYGMRRQIEILKWVLGE